jgi:serine phosphatase RsbU (regulator of sigma subunit)
MNPDGKPFGSERLIDSLERGRTSPLQVSLAALMGVVEKWSSGSPQADDISLLAVEIIDPRDARQS